MPSRRAAIAMTPEEVAAFITEQRVVTCATIGPSGRPHLMPLWFLSDGDAVLCWTYAASQKVRNLERRPQATLQFEAGVAYGELRGVMLECDAELNRAPDAVIEVGLGLAARYAPPGVAPGAPELRDAVARQAPKRVALRFTPTRAVSWDHRKLGA